MEKEGGSGEDSKKQTHQKCQQNVKLKFRIFTL